MRGRAEIKRSVGAPRFFGKIWLCGGGSALVQISITCIGILLLLSVLVQIASRSALGFSGDIGASALCTCTDCFLFDLAENCTEELLLCALVQIASLLTARKDMVDLFCSVHLYRLLPEEPGTKERNDTSALCTCTDCFSGNAATCEPQYLLLCALVQIASTQPGTVRPREGPSALCTCTDCFGSVAQIVEQK